MVAAGGTEQFRTCMQCRFYSLVPRPLPDFISSRVEKSGEGLGSLLRHGLEMVWPGNKAIDFTIWSITVRTVNPICIASWSVFGQNTRVYVNA